MDWKLVVKDVGELSKWMEPVGWGANSGEETEPHVTLLALGGDAKSNDPEVDIKEAHKALQQMVGTEVTFEVTAVAKHEDLIVAEVELPEDVPCALALPYLMLFRSSQKASPGLACQILRNPDRCADSMVFDPPISLCGIISGEEKEDPMNFEGKFLKVENQPLLNKQAEPKGCATFLREEDADAWKAPLAASVKQDPAGPEGCKLKANVQGAGRPGHIYLRWGAAFSTMTAKEIVDILETRLQEIMD